MKKFGSIITMGCLLSSLILSSASQAFAAEDSKNEAAISTETESIVSETEKVLSKAESIVKETETELEKTEDKQKDASDTSSDDGAGQIMRYSDGDATGDPSSLKAYLRENPAKPQEAIVLSADTGAEIDGYHLNHDQVKVLNINTGHITINADTYTQQNGETNAPWDAKSDAYVIRGKGNTGNNLTISSPQTKVTIYLMDLEWNGTITYSQNTQVEFVICGNVINHSNFLTSAQKDTLTIRGLTAEGNSISADGYLFNSCAINNVLIKDIEISAKNSNTLGLLTCHNMVIDHSTVKNLGITRSGSVATPGIVIKNSSNVSELYTYESSPSLTNSVQIIDSIVNDIRNYYYYYKFGTYGTLYVPVSNIYKLTAKNSVLKFTTSPITNIDVDKCSIEVQNTLGFGNIVANSCSIKGAFTGTPVDYAAHDLFLKTLRLRDYPNKYVYVSIDGGEKVKFLTDLNGCVYPYIKAGSTSVSVTTEDGSVSSATFDPISAHDKTVTILTPGGTSGGDSEGGDTEDPGKPEITDATLNDVYVDPGEPFTLTIAAKSMTTSANLTYQWYKDGQPIDTTKGKKKIYSVTIAKAEHVGIYYCQVTDKSNNQTAVSKEVSVTVNVPADPAAPIIMNQSSTMELIAGSSVTLSVNARPANNRSDLSFQWYKGTEALTGKTSRTLTLSKVKGSDAGSYHCVITDNINTSKKTESSATVITVK